MGLAPETEIDLGDDRGPARLQKLLEPSLVAVVDRGGVADGAGVESQIPLAVHDAEIDEGGARGLQFPEETCKLTVQIRTPEPGVVDDVPEVYQAFPEEEIEGVGLVLGNNLQMGPKAVPHQVPVLDVEENRKKEERHHIEENQTGERSPEELTRMFVPPMSLGSGRGPHRLGGHKALYMGQPDTGGLPWTRLVIQHEPGAHGLCRRMPGGIFVVNLTKGFNAP
jgi:hypothetical protein